MFGMILIIVAVLAGFVFIQFKMFSSVSQGEQIPAYKNPKTALLVIDLQKDLTEKSGKAALNPELTDKVIENTNAVIANAKKLKLVVIYIRHEYKKGLVTGLITRGALAEGSPGSQIDPRLHVVNDNIFIKNKMDSFSNPALDEFLRKNEVGDIELAGIDAEACVDRTLKAALNRHYKVTVISNCIATKTEKRLSKKLAEFSKLGAEIAESGDIIANLRYGQSFYQ